MALKPTSEIMDQIRRGEHAGLVDAAEAVGQASDQNTPRDTGDLVKSRRNRVVGTRASITYGEGLPDPRAVITHEDMTEHHDDGGPKYLERALASEVVKVRQIIAGDISRELR